MERTVKHYPETMKAVCGGIPGTSFFPAGDGLYKSDTTDSPQWPVRKIMVIGNDWGTLEQYQAAEHNELRVSTWRGLLKLLEGALDGRSIEMADCFYTNAFMGIRSYGKATGMSPGRKDPVFSTECREFLKCQIQTLQPKLILTLGKWAPEMLATFAPQLNLWKQKQDFGWRDIDEHKAFHEEVEFSGLPGPVVVLALTHPHAAKANYRHRSHGTFDAEYNLLAKALDKAGF